jgi:hypothetical protein
MTAKSLIMTAGVSLVVVLAYEAHKGGKLPKIGR